MTDHHTGRRAFLVTAGIVAIAGCADDSTPENGGSTGDDENGSTDDGAEDGMTADDHIEAALEALRSAEATLGEEIEGFDGATDHVDFRTDAIERDLDDAESALDDAESALDDADPDQRDQIDTIRDTVSWVRALTDTLDSLGTALDDFETAMDYWDVERYGDATDRIDEAESALQDAGDHHTVAVDRFERVEGADIDLDLIDDARSDMADLDEAIEGITPLLAGTGEMSRGFQAFFSGFDELVEERWSAAASDLDEASTRFGSAEDRFRDGEEVAPVDMRSDFIGLTCMSGHFSDAAGHYRDAANAADEGDWDAFDASSDAGEAALDASEDCEQPV